ncbi:MAG: hypothetical protein KJZ77_01760 [Anaerolineales bacterium]|nr:hypothetical protein [Anaerolineales bacterium]
MTTFSASRDFALQLDAQDKLVSFRDQFFIPDPSLVYFDGNSLGMMPKAAQEKSRQIVDEQWGVDRLTMVFTNKHSIREVLLFPALRKAE